MTGFSRPRPCLGMICVVFACACTPVLMDAARAADLCEKRARAAQGPTGSVTVGVNSNSGGFTRTEIGLSSDFLTGRDPMAVYQECVYQRTGQAPIRPPILR